MNALSRRAVAAALVVLVAGAPLTLAVSDPQPARLIVGFTELPEDARPGGTYEDARIDSVEPALRFLAVETLDPSRFQAGASEDPRVRYVEPDPLVPLVLFTPDDPSWSSQHGPQRIGAPAAWDKTLGSANVHVCIVDSGVRRTHQDIPNDRYLGGYDYWNDDGEPDDGNGHGTHVAGTALARTNNGIGIAGVALTSWSAVRVTNAAGQGYVSDVASGMRWCRDNGAHVMTISLGVSSSYSSLRDAADYAWNGGVVVDAAAGNEGCYNCVFYPAAYSNVIAVACTTSSDSRCHSSSAGPEVDVAAPGYSILSTVHDSDASYGYKSGTSMSAPHAAGALALIKAYFPNFDNQQLRDRLQQSARDLGTSGFDGYYGHGLVQVQDALVNLGPATPTLSCEPSSPVTSEDLTCTLSATDPEVHDVWFSLDWGDGTTERVPASGFVASGAAAQATHRYAASQTYALAATATDDVVADAKTSGVATLSLHVSPNTAPAAPTISCSPSPSTLDATVTCTLRAEDDSSGIAFRVDWGDGSGIQRFPAVGFAAPGTDVEAEHAYAAVAEVSIAAYAMDDASPSLAGEAASVAHEVRDCDAVRTGELTAGALGFLRVEGTTSAREDGLPEGCQGLSYSLEITGALGDVNVCWYTGSFFLECHESAGGELGTVPALADAADIIYHSGTGGTYTLRMPATNAGSEPPPPPPQGEVVRDDDGEMDHAAAIDYNDDRATKYLRVTLDQFARAEGARLHVFAKQFKCPGSLTMTLLVNDAPLEVFEPCSAFPADYGVATFDIPVGSLVGGIENSFTFRKPVGSWTSSAVALGVDLDTDNGNSTIRVDGSDVPGELMMWLEIL